jgi:hypothetical protein
MSGPATRIGQVADAARVRAPLTRSTTFLNGIPVALAIVAEAAWIWVVAGLMQEYALREPELGLVAFVGFVAVGAIGAALLSTRLGPRWPAAALALMAIAGTIGWLASPAARAAIGEVGVGHALAVHPGGWLASIAVLRGFAHGRLPLGEQTLSRLLTVGIPGLAIVTLAGGMVAEPWRGRFLADALIAAIAFATSATLSLAMARLTAVGADSGFDWRRNPAWVGLLIVLVAVTAAVAIPASLVAGPLISFLVGVAIGPFILIGLVIGFDRRAVRILAMFVAAAIVLVTVLSIIGQAVKPATPAPAGGVAGPAAPPTEPGQAVAVGAALVVLAAIVATVILARLWMRRVAVSDDGIAETRTIDRGEERRPGRRPSRRRRSTPVDAVSAYLALNEDLAGDRALERRPTETPAEHARRIRAAGRRELGLDLLAADYALARFAGVRLSGAEDRRAIGRWRVLRVRLRSPRA